LFLYLFTTHSTIDHTGKIARFFFAVPKLSFRAMLQISNSSHTPAVFLGALILTEEAILFTLVHLAVFYSNCSTLVLTVLITVITNRPVLTVYKVGVVTSHVSEVKQPVVLARNMFTIAIIKTVPVLSTVEGISVYVHRHMILTKLSVPAVLSRSCWCC